MAIVTREPCLSGFQQQTLRTVLWVYVYMCVCALFLEGHVREIDWFLCSEQLLVAKPSF